MNRLKVKYHFIVFLTVLFCSQHTVNAQQYFEKVIPAPPAGESVREGAYVIAANKDFIRLRTGLSAAVNGPNINARGYLDYNIPEASIGERIYWDGKRDPHNQIFPIEQDSTLIIQSTDLEGRIGKYEWQYVYYINHAKGSYEFWYLNSRRIASRNIQVFNGEYYGLYSHKIYRGQWLHEDTIVLAKIDCKKQILDIQGRYILPFEPDNAGYFSFRPEVDEFDFIFENYKITFNINGENPISIDSANQLNWYEEHARYLNIFFTEYNFEKGENLSVVRKAGLADSIVYPFKRPKFTRNATAVPSAIFFDEEDNILVLFKNIDDLSGKTVSHFIQRINKQGLVLQQIPLRLKILKANIKGLYEDDQGNFILTGQVQNDSHNNVESEIYLARLSAKGLSNELELPVSGQLTLVPNPANQMISLIGNRPNQVYQYQILNTAGQSMAVGRQYLNLNVDVSFLPRGAYYFDIISLDGEPYGEAIRFIKY